MKSVVLQAVIDGVRSHKDRSLGLTISTPELSPHESVVFLQLQGLLIDLKITPREDKDDETLHIDKELTDKSQSQRLRNSLYILLSKVLNRTPGHIEWTEYYHNEMEKIIGKIKAQIDEYES